MTRHNLHRSEDVFVFVVTVKNIYVDVTTNFLNKQPSVNMVTTRASTQQTASEKVYLKNVYPVWNLVE